MNLRRLVVSPAQFVDIAFEDANLHQKRLAALATATKGAIEAAQLGVKVMGAAIAASNGISPKHGIKEVDRLLSNDGINVWHLFMYWVPFVIAQRTEITVVLDWTDFDKDGQTTICLHLLTKHGRATPLLWRTVFKDELKDHRNQYEDEVLLRLKEVLPEGVLVTVLADRGFGDQKLYELLKCLGFGYIIRFRDNIVVRDHTGAQKPAADWVGANGRARKISGARVTQDDYEVPAVVCVWAKGMKEPWCLATNLAAASASQVIKLYGKRFTIEETFRDTKNLRLGMGLTDARIKAPARRDRLLLIGALATALLTLLGAACEQTGFDRRLKANTVKTRTHSLFHQGTMCYDLIPTMRDEWLAPLMAAFGALVRSHRVFTATFGII